MDVQNLLTNSSGFSSDFGWAGKNGSIVSFNKDSGLLELTFNGGTVENSGLSDSLALFRGYNGISKGDNFILLTKTTGTGAITNCLINNSSVSSCERLSVSLVEGYSTFRVTCHESYSYQDLVKDPAVFCLQGSGKVNLQDAKFFKESKITYQIKNADGTTTKVTEIFIPELKTITETTIKDRYYFFKATELNKVITSVDDIVFEGKYFEDEIPSSYIEVPKENPYEKITSITASKSNRFNLIQKLCETFECWARFVIGHESNGRVKHLYTLSEDFSPLEGKIYYQKIAADGSDNDPKNFKVVVISKESPKGKYYEHSLDKKIVFKEYIGKENYAGFRYGINLKGITRNIDSKQIVTKLIVESNSNEYAPDGFCSIQRATMNPSRENSIYNFSYYINNGLLDQDEISVDLYDSVNGIGLYDRLYELNVAAEPLINKQIELKTAYDKALAYHVYHSFALKEAEENESNYKQELMKIVGSAPSTPSETAYNDVVNELIRKRNYSLEVISRESANVTYIEPIITRYKTELVDIENSLSSFVEQKEALNSEFFKKYSRFVQEGTWISEDYFDEDLYYFDACKVSDTSAFPQISYNINVLEVSGMEEYQNYKFEIGDKTYVEDTEFFGYVKETGRPYQEEVIISEIQTFLDNPSNNVIKVQNYKTRFEDLFQRVAAATQALQYAEGKYNRASNAIKEDNTISGSVLEKTLNYNFLLSDAISKEIAQGGQVIDLNSVSQPNRYVRLSGLGIQLSKDGGLNWQTAITADGINADVGVFGSLHTNNLTIYNGDDEAFFWDKNGITAYNTLPGTGTVFNQFVRFTKYGIYGYKGSQAQHYIPVSISEIQRDAIFSLTWNGLALNSINGGNYVRLSTEGAETSSDHGKKIIWAGDSKGDNFIVYEDGSILAKNGEFNGKLNAATGTFKGELSAATGTFNGDISAATGTFKSKINVNSKFIVDANGNVTMSGGINLNGNITWGSSGAPLTSVGYSDITGALKTRADGIYWNGSNIAINANYISAGTIDVDYINLYGDLAIYQSSTSSSVGGYVGYTPSTLDGSSGMHLLSRNGSSEIRVTSNGAAVESGWSSMVCNGSTGNISLYGYNAINIESGSSGIYLDPATGAFVGGSPIATSSDRNKKTEISYDISNFNILFDSLKPAQFRYKNGRSKRLHLGMIAQDIEKTLENCGISSQDMAALVIDKIIDDDENERTEYYIRYEEFIALCIDQIQKLKARVSELENQIIK